MKTFLDEDAEAFEASAVADGFDVLAVSFLGSYNNQRLSEYSIIFIIRIYLALWLCSLLRTELFSECGFDRIFHV